MNQLYLPVLTPEGFHQLAFVEWEGPSGRRPVICVHGLTRNGRDFDRLAGTLADTRPVFCPDMPGRGRSEWLDQAASYAYPTYVSVVAQLIARLGVEEVDWVGTSMGGIIGMMLAAMPGTPIRRLVINDVGPLVSASGLALIAQYVGKTPTFPDVAAYERYLRATYASFGPIDDQGWRDMAEHGHRALPGGGVTANYDPKIAEIFAGVVKDVDLWPIWDRIAVPTLVIRGGLSTLLTRETLAEMERRGPKATSFLVPDSGHAPALTRPHEITAIAGFLST